MDSMQEDTLSKPFADDWALQQTDGTRKLNEAYAAACGHLDRGQFSEAMQKVSGFHHLWAYGLHNRPEPFAGFTFEFRDKDEVQKVGIEFPYFANGMMDGEVVVCTHGHVPGLLLDTLLFKVSREIEGLSPPCQPPTPYEPESFASP